MFVYEKQFHAGYLSWRTLKNWNCYFQFLSFLFFNSWHEQFFFLCCLKFIFSNFHTEQLIYHVILIILEWIHNFKHHLVCFASPDIPFMTASDIPFMTALMFARVCLNICVRLPAFLFLCLPCVYVQLYKNINYLCACVCLVVCVGLCRNAQMWWFYF